MGTIQIIRPQISGPQAGSGVRANPGAFATADGLVNRSRDIAVTNGFKTIAALNMQIYDAEQQSKLAKAATEMDIEWHGFRQQLEAEPDADKHKEIYDKYVKTTTRYGEQFKGDYGRSWQKHYDRRIGDMQVDYNIINRNRRAANAKSNYRTTLEAAIDGGNVDAALSAIGKMNEIGLLAPGEKEYFEADAKRRVTIGNVGRHIEAAPQEVIDGLSAADWREKYPDIKEDDRNGLLNDAQIKQRRNQALGEERTRETYQQSNEELYGLWNKDQLTNAVLDEYLEKKKINSDIHFQYKKLINQTFPKLTDPAAIIASANMFNKFKDGEINYEEAWQGLQEYSRSMTVSDFNGLRRELDGINKELKGGKAKNPRQMYLDYQYRKGLEVLEAMRPSVDDEGEIAGGGFYGPAGSPEEMQRLNKRLQQWMTLMQSNPTDDEIERMQGAMMMDVYEEDGWGWSEGYDMEALGVQDSIIDDVMSRTALRLGQSAVGVSDAVDGGDEELGGLLSDPNGVE